MKLHWHAFSWDAIEKLERAVRVVATRDGAACTPIDARTTSESGAPSVRSIDRFGGARSIRGAVASETLRTTWGVDGVVEFFERAGNERFEVRRGSDAVS